MKVRSSILVCFILMVLGCSKNNASGGPNISVKSYTSQVYNNGQGFQTTLNFSQSGGNISGDSLVIIERRYNQSYASPHTDTFTTLLPVTPSSPKAEFSTSLSWDFIQYGNPNEADTVDFRFILIDQNLRHSDTAVTGKVIIYQF